VALDERRDTARLVYRDGQVFDFALQQGAQLSDDLAARDFTINAMAWPLEALLADDWSALIDPCGGDTICY
jgi:poly(A) polymerase